MNNSVKFTYPFCRFPSGSFIVRGLETKGRVIENSIVLGRVINIMGSHSLFWDGLKWKFRYIR